MPMSIRVDTNIDINENLAVVKDTAIWEFAASEWSRLLAPYVPFETGTLRTSVHIKGRELQGEIEYYQPYAHYMYEGRLMVDSVTGSSWSPKDGKKVYTNRNLTYHGGSLASAHWDKAAEPQQKPKLESAIQEYIGGKL